MFYPEKFKNLRISKKITQQELAIALGMKRLSIIRWEKKQTTPSECDIRTAALYMDISVSEISDLKDFKHLKKSYATNIAELNTLLQKIDSDIPQSVKKMFHDLKKMLLSKDEQLTLYRREKNKTDFIMQNLPFIIYTKNSEDLRYKYVNDAFLTLLPITESQSSVIGNISSYFFGLKDYEQVLSLEKKVIYQKHMQKEILPIPGSNGKRTGEFNIVPILEGGKVTEICCTVQDVTDEYKEEKARLELEKAVNKLNDFVWIAYRDNPKNIAENPKFTFISDSCYNHWGIEKGPLIRGERKLFIHVHPEDKEEVEKWYYSTSYPKKKEFRFLINNKVKYALMQSFNDGNIFWGTMTDITEIRLLEKKRLALENAVNRLNVLIWIGYRENPEKLDDPIEYSYISDSCEKYWGIPKEPLLKGEKILSSYIHPDDQRRMKQWYASYEPGKAECRVLINGKIKNISLQIFREGKIVWGIVADISKNY